MSQYIKPTVEKFVMKHMVSIGQGGGYAATCGKEAPFERKEGIEETIVHTVDMTPGAGSGLFKFTYDTRDIDDRVVLKINGQEQFDSGCVATGDNVQAEDQQGRPIDFSLASGDTVTVEVTTLCNPNVQGSTDFDFTVECAQ